MWFPDSGPVGLVCAHIYGVYIFRQIFNALFGHYVGLRSPVVKIDEERYKKTISSGLVSPPPPLPTQPFKIGDAALEILGEGEDESNAIWRKIDRWILPVILMIYFL
jgi:hypothetical protein